MSLRKILRDDGATAETLLRVVRLLLEGIEQHAIEGDADDRGSLQASLRKAVEALEEDVSAAELLVQVGSALHGMEDYNRRTARYLRRPAGEWQAAVTMLISAMANLQGNEGGLATRLREIGARVRSAGSAEEAHKIRLQLSECLAEAQIENRRQAEADPGPPSSTAGQPSGGFSRPQAEEALAAAWQTDPPSYVAVMVLDRLQIFNLRFGHSVGDEVLRFYSDFLQRGLRPGDRTFRWSNNVLLALLPRPNRLEIVREEVARLMDARCEHTVQTASRTILLPIAARWTVFPSMAAPRLLIHKIDTFAGMPAPKE